MKTRTVITVLTVFIITIVLIGEAYMYIPSEYGYGSNVSVENDELTYTMTSDGSCVYRAVLLDDGSYTPVSSIYIYYDESEDSEVNENVSIAVGGQHMTQRYYLDQVERILRYKEMSDITVLDSDNLKEKMMNDVNNKRSVGKGVIFASGTIPSKLMNDDGTGILKDWISAGGSLYWTGNTFAKYISNGKDVHTTDTASVNLIGTKEFITDTDSTESKDTQFRVPYSLENMSSTYSPKLSTLSNYLASGYSDGEYSTMTYIKCGSGQVCIMGGEFSVAQTRDLGTAICSGLCWCSKIVDDYRGEMVRSVSGTMDIRDLSGNGSLYVYIGEYHTVYGKGYTVKR